MTIDELLNKWLGTEGGAERANYQMFLTELSIALGLPTPHAKGMGLGEYEFEAPVRSEAVYSSKGTKRIDLYKRDHFILEAKQSQLGEGEALPDDPAEEPLTETEFDLFGKPVRTVRKTGTRRRRYDRLMEDARLQAQRYALALPEDHATPPFLIVADIGRAFEIYFDYAGNGRGYRPFPDERGYRIALADLASDAEIAGVEKTAADTLRAIWTDPASIDPRTRAARVTRDIAERLSRVAARLEKDQRDLRPGDAEVALGIEATSLFLMRTLFCMFAEDVELLDRDSFKTFLKDAEGRSDNFWRSGLKDLWSRMNDPQKVNRYWSHGDTVVKYFNGNLFAGAQVFDLDPESKRELRVAADQDWRAVEPAIFGTLLEQVLTSSERAKLGAHYTPRPYVQRLVQATMMDVLEAEWADVLEAARAALDARSPSPLQEGRSLEAARAALDARSPSPSGEGRSREAAEGWGMSSATASGDSPHPNPSPEAEGLEQAIALACDFHDRLTALRVLDPACGTGNFLYVAMENLLRLESEVRQFVIGLGGTLEPAVHPNQFLGLELNPRAAVIAELVLWIGWLRFRLANTPEAIGEPVLPPLSNINQGTHGGYDAVLVRTATNEPDTANPRRPDWPEADFIVGNPPFIGGKDLRDRLGSAYAEALWAANPRVPKSADFVMQWWDRAAEILTRPGTRLRRFGFVTTNSITQVFSRRVIEGWLAPSPSPSGEGLGVGHVTGSALPSPDSPHPNPSPEGEGLDKLHLTLAIPDHPWTRATKDAAAVRIAMTVAEAGAGAKDGGGRLIEIVQESGLDTDSPELEEREQRGRINADLSVGTDVTSLPRLKANRGMGHKGFQLNGDGFVVSEALADQFGVKGTIAHRYFIGSDINTRDREFWVIDAFPSDEKSLRSNSPDVYQHLLKNVRPERASNPIPYRRDNWWLFGQPSTELRDALDGLSRFIVTPRQGKHRLFVFVPAHSIAESTNVIIASDDAWVLGVLHSSIHEQFSLAAGGWMGVGNDPRYFHTLTFFPFAFPEASEGQKKLGRDLVEELHSTRKAALAENDKLTMTGLYNFVAPIREGTLPPEHEAAATRARAFIVAKLHDDLDQAVADAYGWGEEWRRAPLPPAEIVRRLVALNAERAAEEAAGRVRWLRPDYQIPRFGANKG